MFSQKTTSILLIVAVIILSYQTYALSNLSSKLEQAKVGLSGGGAAVDFSSEGVPDMVGGC
ncbi:MAG: hypothetical protein Q8P68_00345 [Candidatus Peregrinibacteria bacterium]|nr:hypothetical protein [Candidatus Peregrinibacteria bacterium]MDZ4244931.1 hypothetical protein [Candidatus Gracilibacteria bacterium]